MKRIKEFFTQLLSAIIAWLNVVIIHPCVINYGWHRGEVKATRGRFFPHEIGYLDMICSDNYVQIDHFRVREEERGNGIGRKLMDALLDRLNKAGYTEIVVYPNSEPYEGDSYLEPAKLYEIYGKLGFVLADKNADTSKSNNKMILTIQKKERPLSDEERRSFDTIIQDLEAFLEIKCPPIFVTNEGEYSYFDEEPGNIVLIQRNQNIMLIDLIHEIRHVWQHIHGKGLFFENYHEEWEFSNKEDYMKQIEELDAIGFSLLIANAITGKDYLCDAGLSDEMYNIIMRYIQELSDDEETYSFYINHMKED